MDEDKQVGVDIFNVECPELYQVEFSQRWYFSFRLPPMKVKDIENLLDELQEKVNELKDSEQSDKERIIVVSKE